MNPRIKIGNDPTSDGSGTVLAFVVKGIHVQSSLYLKIFCSVKVKELEKMRTRLSLQDENGPKSLKIENDSQ